MLLVEPTELKEVVSFVPQRRQDTRGYFCEVYNEDLFQELVGGEPVGFVQDNESLSVQAGTVRGLHYQRYPYAQGKLVRVARGRLIDVCVDIRLSSETFGQHIKIELDATVGRQLWVPPGFAHGFCTLEPNTVISYKVTDFYSAEADRSLLWNDPALAISWPEIADELLVSEKDAQAVTLQGLQEKGELL